MNLVQVGTACILRGSLVPRICEQSTLRGSVIVMRPGDTDTLFTRWPDGSMTVRLAGYVIVPREALGFIDRAAFADMPWVEIDPLTDWPITEVSQDENRKARRAMTDYAALSDAELNRLVAERLGWTDVRLGWTDVGEPLTGCSPNGPPRRRLPGWATDANAALALPGVRGVLLFAQEWAGEMRHFGQIGYSPKPARAIAIAYLRATEKT